MTGVLIITLLALTLGLALGLAAKWLQADDESLVDQIDKLLPNAVTRVAGLMRQQLQKTRPLSINAHREGKQQSRHLQLC